MTKPTHGWIRKGQTLRLPDSNGYPVPREVHLDTCRTPAEILDWILHMNHKGLSPEQMVGLLNILEQVKGAYCKD